MERVILKKCLLHCQTDVFEVTGVSVECIVGSLPPLRYWCSAEHLTPSGTSVTYIFLCFRSPVAFNVLKERIPSFPFHVSCVNSKPSQLFRKYVKETGFSWNLGKSKPVPGTFKEKKGGL